MTNATSLKEKWDRAKKVANECCRHFEDCLLTSYVLPGETWATIGWGKAIPLSQHPKTISQDIADHLLEFTIAQKAACLQKEIPARILEKFSAEALGGLISFRYNMKDSVWLHPKCNTRSALVSGNTRGFLSWHGKWINGEAGPLPGLKRRRRVERDLIEGKTLDQIKSANWYQGLY